MLNNPVVMGNVHTSAQAAVDLRYGELRKLRTLLQRSDNWWSTVLNGLATRSYMPTQVRSPQEELPRTESESEEPSTRAAKRKLDDTDWQTASGKSKTSSKKKKKRSSKKLKQSEARAAALEKEAYRVAAEKQAEKESEESEIDVVEMGGHGQVSDAEEEELPPSA